MNRVPVERVDETNVDDLFTYQPWDKDQTERGQRVRDALVAAAKVILQDVPDCPNRTVAIRNLTEARMNSNAGISFRGRF